PERDRERELHQRCRLRITHAIAVSFVSENLSKRKGKLEELPRSIFNKQQITFMFRPISSLMKTVDQIHSPLIYVKYKVRHFLHRQMFLVHFEVSKSE
uniref:Alpha-1,3-glucosyltransferase n=1 Tax=Parascaris univalens TaxID=6257 RepID=A0A915B7H1_PARUN